MGGRSSFVVENGKKLSLFFNIPMMWRVQRNHTGDCYFCSLDVRGHNTKKKRNPFTQNLPQLLDQCFITQKYQFHTHLQVLDDIYRNDSEVGDTLSHKDDSSSKCSVD